MFRPEGSWGATEGCKIQGFVIWTRSQPSGNWEVKVPNEGQERTERGTQEGKAVSEDRHSLQEQYCGWLCFVMLRL